MGKPDAQDRYQAGRRLERVNGDRAAAETVATSCSPTASTSGPASPARRPTAPTRWSSPSSLATFQPEIPVLGKTGTDPISEVSINLLVSRADRERLGVGCARKRALPVVDLRGIVGKIATHRDHSRQHVRGLEPERLQVLAADEHRSAAPARLQE